MADKKLSVTANQINTGVTKANEINGTASEINTKLASINKTFNNSYLVLVGNDGVMPYQTSIDANQSYDFDLSSYLPNDGKVYDVIVRVTAKTPTASKSASALGVKTDILTAFTPIAGGTTTTANIGVAVSGTVRVPVGTGRTIKLSNGSGSSGTTTLYTFTANGYIEL